MSYLYVTADQISSPGGGGRVTQEESTALLGLATERGEEFLCWGRDDLQGPGENPWRQDQAAVMKLMASNWSQQRWPKLCHVYAGTFSDTVDLLKKHGCKITYTAAAHDIDKSRQEHQKLGLEFHYPHLNEPALWNRYVAGYQAANVVICPSQHSAECMRSYGCKNIEVIPHGIDLVEEVQPLPHHFRVGYLGSCGSPDKGVVYLLQAWKKLNFPGAVLVLGGRDSQSPWVQHLVASFGGGNIQLAGWQASVKDFYNQISLYCQPSITEGFGIEILEAMVHGRMVICSTGAGGVDVIPETWRFYAGDVDHLAGKIDQIKQQADLELIGKVARGLSKEYSWETIRSSYQQVWKELLLR